FFFFIILYKIVNAVKTIKDEVRIHLCTQRHHFRFGDLVFHTGFTTYHLNSFDKNEANDGGKQQYCHEPEQRSLPPGRGNGKREDCLLRVPFTAFITCL